VAERPGCRTAWPVGHGLNALDQSAETECLKSQIPNQSGFRIAVHHSESDGYFGMMSYEGADDESIAKYMRGAKNGKDAWVYGD